ncbi:MAG: hypothetical protein LBP26_05280 [Clostridiales bacterium]|nr:hypothetical protein [Clostridiales bacterium]
MDALFLACMIVFAVLSAKAVGAAGINAVKEALANRAFDKLLTPGTDYTVMAQVAGAVLVKKVVKWAYCYVKGGSVINALFIITTDISTFAFQAQGEKLFRIDDAELPMSMYEFK